MSEPLLSISNLTLEFDLYGKERGFRRSLAAQLGFGSRHEPFKALADVSLTLRRGERVAVMGHNGAGKSSLLKMIAGVYPVKKGRIELRGSIAPLIELGAGFNPHLSARKNIVLNGAMFGYTRQEMLDKTPDILEFAGLTEFADVPLRNYSTGMRRRLGFTIATDMRPDLLIIDEIFAGGDLQFVGRARARMHDLMGRANALLMVSHNLNLLEQFCERGIWLERGRIRKDGPVAEITAAYRASVAQAAVFPTGQGPNGALRAQAVSDEALSDDPEEALAAPIEVDPKDQLHLRIPAVCWERINACHCQGAILPGPHPGWNICRRCRSWVSTMRLREGAARALFESEQLPAGIYPPGIARLDDAPGEPDYAAIINAVVNGPAARSGGHVFQIGCGAGRLLERLEQRGVSVTGLEINHRLSERASAQLSAPVRPGGCDELDAESADVLLCIDYLGRVADPARTLRLMKQALRPNGSLVLCEPIFDDPAAPLSFPAALLSRVMYKYHFSRGAIETLAHLAGFVDVSERGTWNNWPVLELK